MQGNGGCIIKEPRKIFYCCSTEQFTLQTQKEIVVMHPSHAVTNIDIMSFDRMAHRVLEELGKESKEILDDTEKA
jgi:ATP-dependent helicase/nuclease subunit B